MVSHWLEILLIIILILANAFFASSEFALISARKSRISHVARKGNKKALLVQKLQSEPDRFLATVQIGVTLVGTLASVVGGARIVDLIKPWIRSIPAPFIHKASEPIAIGIVVIIIAYLFLVMGELVPKYLALRFPEKIAFRIARPIEFLSHLSFVVVQLLSVSTRGVASLLIGKTPKEPPFISEEEVKYIIREGKEKGIFEPTEAEMIRSVFEFTDTYVHNIMTPRTEIVALDTNADTHRVVRTITEEGYSRIPVYKDNLDNIAGIIYAKDVINVLQDQDLIILDDIIRKPYFVPDSKKISELLREFQTKKIHMAIVLDEFGGTAGLVTLEDILEEIVGEIEDEYDRAIKEVDVLSDGSAIVRAGIKVDDFNRKLKAELPLDIADTLGGFIVNSLGRIPALDERIDLDEMTFIIFEKARHQVKKIKVIKHKQKHK
jgi:putative hemolysin